MARNAAVEYNKFPGLPNVFNFARQYHRTHKLEYINTR